MNSMETNSGRHPLNSAHLVMGIAFASLVGVWALVVSEAVSPESWHWLLPLPWLIAGVVGLLAWMLRGRRTTEPGYDTMEENR